MNTGARKETNAGRAVAALAPTTVEPSLMNGDRMQRLPYPLVVAQLRSKAMPTFGRLPVAITSYVGRLNGASDGLRRKPAASTTDGRSRKNEKFAGVLNERLNVKRSDWFSAALYVRAARGETNWPSITLFRSTRSAPRKSRRLVSAVLPCT